MNDLIKAEIERIREELENYHDPEAKIATHTLKELIEVIFDQNAKIAIAADALHFYADPDSYFAISILDDPPCGEFARDFSQDEWTAICEYDRPMPGKLAREIMIAQGWAIMPEGTEE